MTCSNSSQLFCSQDACRFAILGSFLSENENETMPEPEAPMGDLKPKRPLFSSLLNSVLRFLPTGGSLPEDGQRLEVP